MATRALLLAATVLAFAPGVALAQAVPAPKRPLVGPPVDYRGEVPPRAPIIPAGTPTIGPPGSAPPPIPPPRSVSVWEGMSAAEKESLVSGVGGSTATLIDEGANYLDGRYKHVRGTTQVVTDFKYSAGVLNRTAAVGSAISNYQVAEEKCGKPGAVLADCAQASLAAGASLASLAEAVPHALPQASNVLTRAQTLQVAADAVTATTNCRGKWGTDAFNPFECAASTSDFLISGMQHSTGPAGRAIGATYSIARSVLPAAVDQLGYSLMGKSWGEALYDSWFADDDEDAMETASREQAAKLERMRAQRRAAYQQAASALAAKQQAYDAEQQRIAEQQAAAMAAQARAQADYQNALAMQSAINTTVTQIQQAIAPPPPPPMSGGSDSSEGVGSDSSEGGCGGVGPGTCR